MQVPGLTSPHEKTGGVSYFARMLSKARLHAAGQLPTEYHENLGEGFDGRCCSFLGVNYASVVEKAKSINDDQAILEWVYQNGKRPTDEQIEVWNEFMRKRGWNDEASERLAMRKKESGLADRDDVQTFYDYIDADEGKPVRLWRQQ